MAFINFMGDVMRCGGAGALGCGEACVKLAAVGFVKESSEGAFVSHWGAADAEIAAIGARCGAYATEGLLARVESHLRFA